MGSFGRFSFFFILACVVTSCSNRRNSRYGEILANKAQDRIFSNRAQNVKQTILLLKLKTEPLLVHLGTENGQKIVDQKKAEAIEAEQKAFIENLQKISPEIQVLFR